MLDQVQTLSSEARRQLGSYSATERDRFKVEVNKLRLSSRALYDLADATFFNLFPQQQGKNFVAQPIGQVWHALVADKLNAILAGTAFERIVFGPGATDKQVSGTIQPGEGKAYIAGLAQGQVMEVSLQGNPQVLISVYTPTGKKPILVDSTERSWLGTLQERGFYEFVVVSTASEPVDYQLNITVENPTPAPPTDISLHDMIFKFLTSRALPVRSPWH